MTYSGLLWVGDLIVTGTSVHSRNWRAGDALGRGEKLEDIEANMGMIIEGSLRPKSPHELAPRTGCLHADYTSHLPSLFTQRNQYQTIDQFMTNSLKQ